MTMQSLRVGPLVRRRMERLGRRDAEAVRDAAERQTEPVTPTVAAMQAHANAYARREEQRFLARAKRRLSEHRVLASAVESDLDAYEKRLEGLEAAERSPAGIAGGRGAEYEQLRRLQRRLVRDERRREELEAAIHARFMAAKLRAGRHFDRSDEKIAIYWGAFRSYASPARVTDRAPELQRSDWLMTRENTKILQLWQGRTDVTT